MEALELPPPPESTRLERLKARGRVVAGVDRLEAWEAKRFEQQKQAAAAVGGYPEPDRVPALPDERVRRDLPE
jgi:hypothetical protein